MRFIHLDALRGFALFGILLVNMNGFKTPLFSFASSDLHLPGHANTFATYLISVLAAGKFIAIFSFLFGMGLAIQWRRWGQMDGAAFKSYIRRRMGFLLVLGILHGILLWPGDILGVYGLIGLIGSGLVRRSTRFQLTFASIILILLSTLLVCSTYWITAVGEGNADELKEMADSRVQGYQSSDIGWIIHARIIEWGIVWMISLIFQIPYALIFILIGMAVGKLDALALVDKIRNRRPVLLFLVGLLFCLLNPITDMAAKDSASLAAIGAGGMFLGSIIMACSYIIASMNLFRSGKWPRLTSRLAAVGRLSLSNYLFQSIAANVLFMGWGFGLYGKTPALAGLGITVLIYALQVILSHLWLLRFQSGPMEYLWRKIAYPSRKEEALA